MAYETLLTQVSIPEANIHRMQGELPPDEGALPMSRSCVPCLGRLQSRGST
jgi:hypothetical protein